MPDQADLARQAEAVLRKRRGAGMINVEVTDQAGGRRVLMVRFPRTKLAIGTGVVTAIVLGLPWLNVPFLNAGEGWLPWAMALAIVLVLALLFGWFLVLLLITAVRGGYLALTQTGVLIKTGLSSVLIPWTAISGTSADTDGTKARNPVLRLSLRSDYKVPGWPWPAALSPVLLGSSRRKLRILAWWFQPVPLDRMVAVVRYLASHPEERPRIGSADPDEWLQAPPAAGPG
jgi:hypothetical protein